jgi:hypothetical protein
MPWRRDYRLFAGIIGTLALIAGALWAAFSH